MALEINDGSLMWEAGVDTSGFDKDIESVGRKMIAEMDKQTKAQERQHEALKQSAKGVSGSFDVMADSVKKAMGGVPAATKLALQGVEDLGGEAKAAASKMVQAISGAVDGMKAKLQTMQGAAFELKAKGIDTTALTTSIEKVQAMVDALQSEELTLKAGKVDTTAMLAALDKVQAEFAQLSQETISLKVGAIDTASVKGAFDGLKKELANIEGAAISVKVDDLDTSGIQTSLKDVASEAAHVDHAMRDMAEGIESAMDAVPKAAGKAAASTKEIARQLEGVTTNWQQLNGAFHGIFHGKSGDASLGAQWQKIKAGDMTLQQFVESLKLTDKQLEKLPAALEKVGYVAKGTFTEMSKAVAGIPDVEVKVKGVDTQGLTAALGKIEAGLKNLDSITLKPDFDKKAFEKEYKAIVADLDKLEDRRIKLQAAGIDTAALDNTLNTLKKELDAFRGATLEIKVGSIDTASVRSALADLKADLNNPLSTAIELQVKGFDTTRLINAIKDVEQQADKLEGISIDATLNTEDFTKEYVKLTAEVRKLESETVNLKAAGIDTTQLDRDIAGLRDKMQDLGKLGESAKTSQTAINSLSTGVGELSNTLSALTFVAAKGAGLDALQREAKETGAAFVAVIGQAKDLKTAVGNIGGGVVSVNTAGVKEALAEISKVQGVKPVEVPVKFSLLSLNEMNSRLDDLKRQFGELSGIDRDSDVGKTMLRNMQQLEDEIERVNAAFANTVRSASGSLDSKVAAVARLKAEYSALSEADRNSDIGKNLAKNIKGMDREIEKINRQFSQTESIVKQAALAIGGYFSFQAATSFVSDIVRVRGEFQRLEAVLTNSIGAEGAAKALKELQEYAATSPEQLNELTAAYVKLTNMGLQPSMDEMRALGDIAASTGKNFDQLAEAIIDAQSGEFERLKEFGIRAEKDGEKVQFAFKGIKTEVDFTAQSIKDYIIGLGKLEGVQGATAAIAGTLEGQISALKDAWAALLNSVGESNDGLFSTAISGLTTLVKNYETVLDILKVLVVTYGAYKAATIASTAVTAVYDVATKRLVISQTLQATASTIASRAMAVLNTTMKANPAGLIVAGVAALASAMLIFGTNTNKAAKAQEDLNKIASEAAASVAKEKEELGQLLKIARDETASKVDREAAMRKINAISPEYLGNITKENINTKESIDAINKYIAALDRKAKAQAANRAKDRIEDERANELLEVQDKRTNREIQLRTLPEKVRKNDPLLKELQQDTDEINKAFDDRIKKINEAFGDVLREQLVGNNKSNEAAKKTVEYYDKLIAAKKKDRDATAENSAAYKGFNKEIADLEAKREAITGKSEKAQKAQNAAIEKGNDLLDKRKDILSQIAELEAGATRSGQVEDPKQKELDAINDKYNKAFEAVAKFNKEVAEANKKNGTRTAQIGQPEIARLNVARTTELRNADLKADAEAYLKHLEEQKAQFEKFEDLKKQVGIDKAREMFEGQTKGFDDYLSYLQSEAAKQAVTISLGVGNIGDVTRFQGLMKEIKAEDEKRAKAEIDRTVQLFQISATYTDKLAMLREGRERDIALLQKKYTGEDLKQRTAAINQFYKSQAAQLEDELIKLSPAFQKLGESLLTLNRDKLKAKVKELQKILRDGFTTVDMGNGVTEVIKLTPEMIAALESGVQNINGLIATTGKLFGVPATKLNEMANRSRELASVFSTLADAFAPLNSGLSEAMSQISDMANTAGTALSGAAAFASGDYIAAAQSAAQLVGQIVTVFAEAKKSAEDARRAVSDFYLAIQFGEIQTAMAMRERMLVEAQLKDLTLERLQAEREALDKNKRANQEQFNLLLKQLQQEQYISDQRTKKGKGNPLFGLVGVLAGWGAKTKVESEMASLVGKSFEQIEQLFNSGQLTDKAKALFGELQKLKQEGVDIDRQLQELKKEAQQIYTGTTATDISRMIRDGFGEGLRSVEQFGDKTTDIIRNALLNGLEYGFIQKQVQALYEQLAVDAEDGGGLDSEEIKSFYSNINKVIEDSAKIVEQIEKETGVALSKAGQSNSGTNSLAGSIKASITEETGTVVAGHLGAMRVNLIEQLNVSKQGLEFHRKIEMNTLRSANANEMILELWKRVEQQGMKVK